MLVELSGCIIMTTKMIVTYVAPSFRYTSAAVSGSTVGDGSSALAGQCVALDWDERCAESN